MNENKKGEAVKEPIKRKSVLPLIGLAFSLCPVLLFLMTIIGYENADIYFLSLLHWLSETILMFSIGGVLFCVAGVIFCVVALCKGKVQIGRSGVILSIITILWSFFWIIGLLYIGRLMNLGRFP